ncbi:hypothetical protein [Halomontanus rarus]|uniref:DNA replication complex subunit Gins51 n=1 Tax=Halomontanus rarus TaxID=3034020 RepID=UPI003CE4B27B
MMVRITEKYDNRFTGTDLRVYGPFEKGDIVRLPEAEADILADRGYARRIRSKS